MNERSLFDGLMRGPEVLHQVKTNLATLPKGASVERMVQQTLADNDYMPSAKQLEVMRQSLPIVQEHRDALQRAFTLYQERPYRMREEVARFLKTSPDDVQALEFHETSVTVTVPPEVIEKEEEKANQVHGAIIFDGSTSIGLSNPAFIMKVRNKRLPLSLKKPTREKKQDFVGKHENDHVQQRYLHPEWGDLDYDEPEDFLGTSNLTLLQEKVEVSIDQNNRMGFIKVIDEVMYTQLCNYLDELGAEARTNYNDVYQEAFGEGYNYAKEFRQNIAIINHTVLHRRNANIAWLSLVAQKVKQAEYKAALIDQAYQQLVKKNAPYLTEITQMLTPEQGFIINAFVDGNPTFSKMKQWQREYERNPSLAVFEW